MASFFFIIVSCGQRNTNKQQIEIEEIIIDTLATYPVLPEAPLISTSLAYRSNPSITGRISGWEKRLDRMYVDSLHRVIKTMEMDNVFNASESPIPLYNDLYPGSGPILLHYKNDYGEYSPEIYWDDHPADSVINCIVFSNMVSSLFDCRFGDSDLHHIIDSACPIELKDTLAFRAVVSIKDEESGKVFSPLFECYYRQKPFLICSFDIDKLQSTAGGLYFWNIIRNYTYSDYFRQLMPHRATEMTYETWFDTLMPGFRLMD